MVSYNYTGLELEVFAAATNWKSYFSTFLEKYIGSEVLEVGAGIGNTTRFLCSSSITRWVCLEPDVHLARRLKDNVENGTLPASCQVVVGTLINGNVDRRLFHMILYIDVL